MVLAVVRVVELRPHLPEVEFAVVAVVAVLRRPEVAVVVVAAVAATNRFSPSPEIRPLNRGCSPLKTRRWDLTPPAGFLFTEPGRGRSCQSVRTPVQRGWTMPVPGGDGVSGVMSVRTAKSGHN